MKYILPILITCSFLFAWDTAFSETRTTGNILSKATISGSVYDLTGKRAKKIASVSPQVLAGLGSTQEESISIALTNSAEESAKQLINALNNRGVK